MKLIKPYYEILPQEDIPLLESIEVAARTCYKSEDKITDGSAVKLVETLVNRKHDAMLEFGHNIILELDDELCDRYILDGINIEKNNYIHFTQQLGTNKITRNVLSGSARAIRELFKDHIRIIRYLKSEIEGFVIIASNIETKPLDYNDYSTSIKVLRQIDLTPEELAVHGVMTVKFVCDRGVSHELVRHRSASFAQESTRYCNYGKDEHIKFIIPSWMKEYNEGICTQKDYDNFSENDGTYNWFSSMIISENIYNDLIKKGWKPQQARSILPNSLKTEIVVKTTYKHWHHIFTQRVAKTAHPQMRELMCPLLDEVKQLIPNIFDDISY